MHAPPKRKNHDLHGNPNNPWWGVQKEGHPAGSAYNRKNGMGGNFGVGKIGTAERGTSSVAPVTKREKVWCKREGRSQEKNRVQQGREKVQGRC